MEIQFGVAVLSSLADAICDVGLTAAEASLFLGASEPTVFRGLSTVLGKREKVAGLLSTGGCCSNIFLAAAMRDPPVPAISCGDKDF